MATRQSLDWPLWVELLLLGAATFLVNRLEPGLPPRPASRSRPAAQPTRQEGAFETRPSQEPDRLQIVRAAEPGRGRGAHTPGEIPARGWKDILWRTYEQIGEDRLLAVGAGAAFYLLLAVFPAITAFVSLYGLFADPHTIGNNLAALSGIVPAGAITIVQEQVRRLTETSNTALGFAFFFALLLALWSANAGMKAIIDALNVVYDEKEKRGFFKLNLISLAFTLGAFAVMALALASVVVVPLVMGWIGLASIEAQLVAVLRWPLLMIVIAIGLAVLYRFAPSREQASWRWLSAGSIFAMLAWLGGSLLFSWYLSNFANYDATYGSLGAAIGFLMWLWLSAIVILVGAELNAEIEHQTARDTTTGREQPLGARGATMADTVGKSWRWREV